MEEGTGGKGNRFWAQRQLGGGSEPARLPCDHPHPVLHQLLPTPLSPHRTSTAKAGGPTNFDGQKDLSSLCDR